MVLLTDKKTTSTLKPAYQRQPGKSLIRELASFFPNCSFKAGRGCSPSLQEAGKSWPSILSLWISWSSQASNGVARSPAIWRSSLNQEWLNQNPTQGSAGALLLPGPAFFSPPASARSYWNIRACLNPAVRSIAQLCNCMAVRELRKTGAWPAPPITRPGWWTALPKISALDFQVVLCWFPPLAKKISFLPLSAKLEIRMLEKVIIY